MTEITKKLSSKELEMEEHKKTVEENTDKKYELQASINEQDINYQNYQKRQTQIKNEITGNISELDNTRMKKEEIAKEFYGIESKRNKILTDLEEVNKEKQEADRKIKDFDSKINMLSEKRELKNQN